MSEGLMQQLIDKIRKEYPKFTNKISETDSYVYVVKNQELLIDIGRSTKSNTDALTGHVTNIKHPKSGIAMMASSYNGLKNNIYYIPTTKTKGAEIEKELKQIEKNIRSIVVSHYNISDKKAGDTYCSGMTKNKEVGKLLKKFLYQTISPDLVKELNEPMFSFTELLDMVTEDGDSWDRIITNQKSAQLACKLLGVRRS